MLNESTVTWTGHDSLTFRKADPLTSFPDLWTFILPQLDCSCDCIGVHNIYNAFSVLSL